VPYADLREYLDALDGRKLLKRISRAVDKDWGISTRVAFQRIPTAERPALGLFRTCRQCSSIRYAPRSKKFPTNSVPPHQHLDEVRKHWRPYWGN
jgi:hypothetical protein